MNIRDCLPEFPKEFRREVHKHEVLLSFLADEDAEIFMDWWHGKGEAAFLAWIKKRFPGRAL